MLKCAHGKKPLALLAAVLVVGVTTLWLSLRQMQERKEFLGRTDPASGFRCRFTLPRIWQRGDGVPMLAVDFGSEATPRVDWNYFTPPPNVIRQWIESRILHRAASRPPDITLTTSTMEYAAPGRFPCYVVNGFPEKSPYGPGRIRSSRHMKVDGYPATVVRIAGIRPGAGSQGMSLLVFIPEHSICYTVDGTAEKADFEEMRREMQTLISTFHVEHDFLSADCSLRLRIVPSDRAERSGGKRGSWSDTTSCSSSHRENRGSDKHKNLGPIGRPQGGSITHVFYWCETHGYPYYRRARDSRVSINPTLYASIPRPNDSRFSCQSYSNDGGVSLRAAGWVLQNTRRSTAKKLSKPEVEAYGRSDSPRQFITS